MNSTFIDADSERGVLSCMMLKPKLLIPEVSAKLQPEWFFEPCNRILFSTILDVYEKGLDAGDYRVVTNVLRNEKLIDEVGDAQSIKELYEFCPSWLSFDYYCEGVRKSYLIRQAQMRGKELEAVSSEQELREVVIELTKVLDGMSTAGDVPIKEVVREWEKYLEEITVPGNTTGVLSGIPALDEFTCGFQPGDLAIIAAETSHGKTSFALQILNHAAFEQKLGVSVFSLEMSNNQILNRMSSNRKNIAMRNFKRGTFTERDYPNLTRFMKEAIESNIWFYPHRCASLDSVISAIRRHHDRHGIKLAIVDYIQLVEVIGMNRNSTREQEIGSVSTRLKALASELNISVIGISQLNDEGKVRGSRQPKMDCDILFRIVPDGDQDLEVRDIILRIEKGRNIGEASFPMTFDRQTQSFASRKEKSEPSERRFNCYD